MQIANFIAELLVNLVIPDTKKRGLEADFPIEPWQLRELAILKESEKLSGAEIKALYKEIRHTDRSPVEAAIDYIENKTDSSDLKVICKKVIEDNPKQVEKYKVGQTKMLNYFVGQVMRQVGKTASASDVKVIFEELL